jgi:DnaJ-domain-containing protein 1
MFEGISRQELFIIICALFFGFGLVRLMLTKKEKDESSESFNKNNYDSSEERNNESWYEILEVDSSASLEEIKSAYKRKTSKYHPDKVSSLGPEFTPIAEKMTKQINAAYDEAIRKFR